jgi:putative ABC transport system permease protein
MTMEHLLQDVRFAVRAIRGNLRFSTIVVTTLAVAIGMNTAIFSVFNAVVMRPLPFPSAERLVWLSTIGTEGDAGLVTGPDFIDWRNQALSFDRMAAYVTGDQRLSTAAGTARIKSAEVTEDFWTMTGALAATGRLPGAGERDVVLAASHFARRWLVEGENVVGRTVRLDDRQVTIIGVLPDSFRFHLPTSFSMNLRGGEIDVYRPLEVSDARRGPMQLLNVSARLKNGVTIETARAELQRIRQRIAQAHPDPFAAERMLRVISLRDQLIGSSRRALVILLGAVFLVLLIACANVANLLLAHGSGRHREVAVRIALGAARSRIVMQLLVETLALAALGSAAGLVVARIGTALIVRLNPLAIPRLTETSIDGRVLAVVLVTCVFSVVLAGFAPALALWRTDPQDALKGGGKGPTRAGGGRTRAALVAVEVALALVLLTGTGLLLNSAWRLHSFPEDFTPERILTARIELAGQQYSEPHRRRAFAGSLLERLRREPGVEAASVSTHGESLSMVLRVDGMAPAPAEEVARKPPIVINATSAALREVLGIRVVRGRWFTDGEAAVAINESLVQRDFPGIDPIGRRIRLNEKGPPLTIAGIVADSNYSSLDAPAEPELFVPYERDDDALFGFTAMIRTTVDPSALAGRFRSLVSEIDGAQAPYDASTLEQTLAESIAPRRLNLALFAVFAAAALFLAAIGVYGVLACAVAQRERELGIRTALGARRTDLVSMVVRQGMGVVLVGIGAGVVAALVLTRFMETLLYEVRSSDPLTLTLVVLALSAMGLLACVGPALRAAGVDPIEALRRES